MNGYRRGFLALPPVVKNLILIRLGAHTPSFFCVDEARDRAAHLLPDPDRQAKVIHVAVGEHDPFDIGRLETTLPELVLQELEGPRKLGCRVDQGHGPRTHGIDIRCAQVGVSRQRDCDRADIVNRWKGLHGSCPVVSSIRETPCGHQPSISC